MQNLRQMPGNVVQRLLKHVWFVARFGLPARCFLPDSSAMFMPLHTSYAPCPGAPKTGLCGHLKIMRFEPPPEGLSVPLF